MRTAPQHRDDVGTTVLAPSGELDLSALPALRARLLPAVREGATVVLDLQDVTFIDSSALSVVLTAERHLRATGGALRLANVAEEVLRLLRICGLAERLVPHPEPVVLPSWPAGRPCLVTDVTA